MLKLKILLSKLFKKKKPIFIEKIDKWQTEMYNFKVVQEMKNR